MPSRNRQLPAVQLNLFRSSSPQSPDWLRLSAEVREKVTRLIARMLIRPCDLLESLRRSGAMPTAADNQTLDAVQSSAECARLVVRRTAPGPSRSPRAPAAGHGETLRLYTLCASIGRATSPSLVGRPRRRRAQPGRLAQNIQVHRQLADLALEPIDISSRSASLL